MNIAVACGGTGGHIFPGLATAQVLKQRGHTVSLWLAGRDVENTSVADWQGNVIRIRASGFPSGLSWQSVCSVFRLSRAVAAALIHVYRLRPDVMLCMGSYASVGPTIAAKLLGIPVVLHEANAVPGRAISFLARLATHVAVGFESAIATLPPKTSSVVTGFPLRQGFPPTVDRRVDKKQLCLLVMGGSQGAHTLNTRMPAVARQLEKRLDVPLRVIHLAGRRDVAFVKTQYHQYQLTAEVYDFVTDMAAIYARADIAVARSGAASCTELAVCGVPAVLIPLPHAPRNHQLRNAEAMVASGGMRVMQEVEFTVDKMADYLYRMAANFDQRRQMQEALLTAVPADGAERLAGVVEASVKP